MTRPRFYVWWQFGGTHQTNLGALPDGLKTKGWVKQVAALAPYHEWAGPEAGAALHHAFGVWTEVMELDSYDWATRSGAGWPTHEFAKAWGPVCEKLFVKAYVGGTASHSRLLNLTPAQFQEMVRRNVQPYRVAGMAGLIVDATSDAITYPHTLPGVLPVGGRREISRDAFTLAVIDNSNWFAQRTDIEATPRSFGPWKDLATRDCWIEERTYRQRHSDDSAVDLGFGRGAKYVKGRVHRILYKGDPPTDTPEKMVAYARQVVADGHVPVVPAWFLKDHCNPSDFLETK